jgi:flagellar biosynthesis protein FlhA
MGLSRAIDVFTRLTIGEGLACQIPAFLVSIATGVLLTRNNQPLNLSATFLRQLFGRPIVLVMAAVCLSLLAITRLPPVPLLSLAAICGLTVIVQTRAKPADSSDEKNSAPDSSSPEEHDFRVEDLLRVDPLEIQIGVNLLPLADPRRGGDLLQRISAVRNEIALELGLILPKVRVRDDFSLSADAYRIKICQFEVAQGSLLVERLLVQGDNLNQPDLDGIPFNPFAPEQGLWVEPAQAEVARSHGCAVISAAAVLAQHLKFAAKHHADQLLTRDATQHLIDLVRRTAPAAVDDLIPNQLRVSDVQQILQSLLREGVSIRRLALILETLGDSAGQTKEIGLLGEAVRQRLAPAICRAVSDSTGTVHAARLPPALEAQLAGRDAVWTAEEVAGLVDAARNAVEPLLANGRLPVVLVAQEIRARVKRFTSATFPDLIVLGSAEVGGQNVALAKSPAAAA